MARELRTLYEIPLSEFKAWAEKHDWLCVRQTEHDFGEKMRGPGNDTTQLAELHVYLASSGVKISVLIENGLVKAIS